MDDTNTNRVDRHMSEAQLVEIINRLVPGAI